MGGGDTLEESLRDRPNFSKSLKISALLENYSGLKWQPDR